MTSHCSFLTNQMFKDLEDRQRYTNSNSQVQSQVSCGAGLHRSQDYFSGVMGPTENIHLEHSEKTQWKKLLSAHHWIADKVSCGLWVL